MLGKLIKNIYNKKNSVDAVAENGEFLNHYNKEYNGYTNKIDYCANCTNDNDLKCVPKSDYIYNCDILTESYLENLSVEEKNKLILELQQKNKSVREENEQFRQKNFILYMKLRKLGTD